MAVAVIRRNGAQIVPVSRDALLILFQFFTNLFSTCLPSDYNNITPTHSNRAFAHTHLNVGTLDAQYEYSALLYQPARIYEYLRTVLCARMVYNRVAPRRRWQPGPRFLIINTRTRDVFLPRQVKPIVKRAVFFFLS